MKNTLQRNITFILFLFSGALSLIFQVVWLKNLVLVFGNTVWAVSTLLTTFMGGLALGSWGFGRIADRVDSPLKLYGILEGCIGGYGAFTLLIFQYLPVFYIPLYRLSGGDTMLMGLFKFILALLVLLPPTVCMGGTLPLLASQFTRSIHNAGTRIGTLYTVNTLGAVAGVFLAGFLLIPLWGLRLTTLFAASLSFVILLIVLWLTQGTSTEFPLSSLFRIQRRASHLSTDNWVLWVYLIAGFCGLAYEVIWNRVLVLHLGSSVYAYSVMLAIYLLGVALGSAIMSYFLKFIQRPVLVFAVIQLLIAFDLILLIRQFSVLPETLFAVRQIMDVQQYGWHIVSYILGVQQIIIIPTLLFGASFPLAVRLFVKVKTELGQDLGVLYAFNTFGNILGSFGAGFLLLPLLGAQRGLLTVATLNLGLGAYLITKLSLSPLKKLAIIGSAALLFYGGYAALTTPDQLLLSAGVFRDNPQAQVKLLAFEEDVYATVTVEERQTVRGTWKQLSMNGVNVAGTSSELFSIQKLQGHLPLLLHHDPKRVLHIGFGSGGTAWAVSRHPVEKITIAEISKSVIQTASRYFTEINHGVLQDSRVNVVFTDGRNKVLADATRYDVILSDSIHPRFSGNGSLYTYEYYSLLKNRLAPGGVVSQWLPFYSLTPENFKMIIKSFYEVFPNTSIWFTNNAVNAYVIVIGKLDEPTIDYAVMERRLQLPEVQQDLAEIDCETPYKLLDFFLFANEDVGEFVAGVPLHTDDNMAVEYLSGRVVDRQKTTYLNLKHLIDYRSSVTEVLSNLERAQEPPDMIISTINRYEAATTHNVTGQVLLQAGKRQEAFAHFERIPAINPDDLEPVEYFGASYQEPFLKEAHIESF